MIDLRFKGKPASARHLSAQAQIASRLFEDVMGNKGKAEYINKRLVKDWTSLMNWLQSRHLDYRTEWDERSHEMDSHEMSEHQAYNRAINDVENMMCRLMNEWPDLDAHRKSSSSTMT